MTAPNVKQRIAAAKLKLADDHRMLQIFKKLDQLEVDMHERAAALAEEGKLTAVGIAEQVEQFRDTQLQRIASEFDDLSKQRAAHFESEIKKHTPPPPKPLPPEEAQIALLFWNNLAPSAKQDVIKNLHDPQNQQFAQLIATTPPAVLGISEFTRTRAESIVTGTYQTVLKETERRMAAHIAREQYTPEDPRHIAQAKLDDLASTQTLFMSRVEALPDLTAQSNPAPAA